MKHPLLLVAALMLAVAKPSPAQGPGLFTEQSLSAAMQTANDTGKPLIVYVSTVYAGPGKHMDRTTWNNPVLADWISTNAIAVRIDLFGDRHAAHQLGVHDAPATILMHDSVTVYRGDGYRSAEELLLALDEDAAAEQASVIDREQHRWTVDETQPVELFDLSMRIHDLMSEEDYQTALAGYVWLWRHGPRRRGVQGSRSSYLHAMQLHELTMAHPPAMKQFRIYRNGIERRLINDTATFDDLDDWILLNEAVDEQERTIEWIIRIKDGDRFAKTFRKQAYDIQRLLIDWSLWKLLGEIHPDPVASAKRALQPYIAAKKLMEQAAENAKAPAAAPQLFDAFGAADPDMIDFHTENNAEIYAACLAANRDAEAKQIAAIFQQLDTDGSLHILLVRQALKANALRDRHLGMIDQAAKMGTERAGLRSLVERMLGAGEENEDIM